MIATARKNAFSNLAFEMFIVRELEYSYIVKYFHNI